MKILILFAHPAFQKSKINKVLVKGIQDIPNVTFHDLYEQYPEFDIDAKKEQELLLGHDVIVFHHPLFWYSTPSILKEWMDIVLEHGWAYGKEGNALHGKFFFQTITTGGPAQAYTKEGMHAHTLEEILLPVRHTVGFCGMTYLPPYVVHSTFKMVNDKIYRHRYTYHEILKEFTTNAPDIKKLNKLQYMNDYLKNEEVNDARQ